MDAIATLVRSIFQKDSLHDCSVEELESLARQYPYFTPAQLLLAEKLKSVDENRYKEQLQKLSLHFSNPLWLDYLLNGHDGVSVIEPEDRSEAPETPAPEIAQQAIEPPPEQTFIKSEPEIIEPIKEEIVESISVALETAADSSMIEPDHSIEAIPGEKVENASLDTTQPGDEAIAGSADELPEEESRETFAEETPDSAAPTSIGLDEEQDSAPLHIPTPNMQKDPTETELTFEPYHTVDYFASQGIKFVPEEKPADRFGQQLKSFTEWLKTMKRLPSVEIKMADPSVDEKIQRLADHSITEGDIVTESMAEVWAKQGNKEKAIEIYNKLSLLNPDKSAYFASLLDQLKNS
jgi:hypothetical protein